MPSDRFASSHGDVRPSRRRLLATLGTVASASVAGCGGVLPSQDSEPPDDASEVIVENGTDSRAEITVRVVDREDETLFSRVFVLESEEMIGRGEIETTPSKVHAFTPAGVSNTWRYAPDLPVEFDCDLKDIGLTLHSEDTIESWYTC